MSTEKIEKYLSFTGTAAYLEEDALETAVRKASEKLDEWIQSNSQNIDTFRVINAETLFIQPVAERGPIYTATIRRIIHIAYV